MKQTKTGENQPQNHGFLSEKLALEFQSVLREQYGKIVSLSEAQQIGLRIAQFVFLKEVRRREAT